MHVLMPQSLKHILMQSKNVGWQHFGDEQLKQYDDIYQKQYKQQWDTYTGYDKMSDQQQN